jgi:general L-amino acid transport system permease protein
MGCTAYVELMRSLPLLLVIYLLWAATPLLFPTVEWQSFSRGLVGLSVFFAAYSCEYIRSGLQSVPQGQVDAARALGLRTWQIQRHIVFPQAMKVMVPTLVGNVLDIFNATPLLFIIGLTDLLRAGQIVLASPAHAGKETEVYVLLLAVYFLIGSALTYASRRLEGRLHVTARRPVGPCV